MASCWALATLLVSICQAGQGAAPKGQALFNGTPPLAAHLRNQDVALPPVATRCSNCHQTGSAQPGETSLGPALNAGFLLKPLARHGGPATVYDQASFCRVLRTSVAPGEIVIAQAMPQFDINDAHCQALWHYLTMPTP